MPDEKSDRLSKDDISELTENSFRLSESEHDEEFSKWDNTDTAECDHRYGTRSVDYLDQWDEFTERTTAEKLSVCEKCGFIPEEPRR